MSEKREKSEISKKSAEFEAKTYVITSAQGIQNPYSADRYGRGLSKGEVNEALLNNIEKYVENNSGELIICGIPGAYVNEIELDEFFHNRKDVCLEKNAKKRLHRQREKEKMKRNHWKKQKEYAEQKGKLFNNPYPYHFFWETIPETDYNITGKRLNTNIRLVGIPEPSQNKDPLVGKDVFTKKHGGNSIVMPGSKQRLATVASGQAGEYPKLKISTGCCTHPNYNTTNRTGFLADEAHEYGFCVVDVLDDKLYLPRLVPAKKNGTFIDLGIKYSPGKSPKKIDAYALILGDSHTSEIDYLTDKANDEMIDYFNPKFIHLNDVFNASSINLHELEDEIIRSEKSQRNANDLEEELFLTGEYILKKSKLAKKGKILINYSNHDDMLYRWLAKGQYKNDDKNRKIAHKILAELEKEDSALEIALKVMGYSYKNVRFLKLGEDAIYWGYQCSAHGHKGKNGARGSLKSLMEGYGKVIMAHCHQLEVNQGSISVGTSSKIPLDYQKGQPSTSIAGNAVVYEGGLAQALPIIKGRWKKN